MNENIELVKKFRADRNSVSLEELKANADESYLRWMGKCEECTSKEANIAWIIVKVAKGAVLESEGDLTYFLNRYDELTEKEQ